MNPTEMRTAAPNGGSLALADDVMAEVRAELARAYKKFPRLSASLHEAYAVLLEEVDELWDEIKTNAPDARAAARAEAIQVAAMALRLVVDCYHQPHHKEAP